MSYVPNHQDMDEQPWSDDPKTITIHVQRENKRPVGFAAWPKQKKAKKKGKR